MFDHSLRLIPTEDAGVWRVDEGSLALRVVDAAGPVWNVRDDVDLLEVAGDPRSGFLLWSWGAAG